MDPYDKEKTRQIWKRVLGEECSEARATDSARLRELIAAEKTAARVLAAWSRCICGETLQRIAREEACHARKLETVYFLWTGECADVCIGDLPCYGCAAELLRAMHRAKLEAAASYRQAAEELPEYRCLFLALAEEETRQADCFFALLQRYIASGT